MVSMHRWFLWLGPVLLILAGVAILSWQNRHAPIRVPLTNERELRILKVSVGTNHTYSTEPYWKQGARWVLPKKWQGFLGPTCAQQIPTPYDSMLIWLEVVHPTNGHLAAPKSQQIKARMPEGYWVEGSDRSVVGGVIGCFKFDRFDRASRQVPLQFHDGTNTFPFTVDNPRPARPAAWTAKPLAQTNQLFQTQVVLWRASAYSYRPDGTDLFQVGVVALAPESERTGWIYCRVTGFDSLGNWSRSGWHGAFSPILPMLSTQAAPWKLDIEAKEFISMGLVPSPTQGSHSVCRRRTRAQELGVFFVMVADGGSYAITNGIVTRHGGCKPSSVRLLPSAIWTSETNWSLQLTMQEPSILCVSDNTAGFPKIQARLRERIGGNDGRIFWARPESELHFRENPTRAVSLFPIRLPNSTTNLEAEIIALHPTTEFFVNPPRSERNSRF